MKQEMSEKSENNEAAVWLSGRLQMEKWCIEDEEKTELWRYCENWEFTVRAHMRDEEGENDGQRGSDVGLFGGC